MTPIDFSKLSTRTANCLRAENIEFVEHLTSIEDRILLRTPNMGRRSVEEIRAVYPFDDYVKCISKPLTYDQLGDMYQEQTGQSARSMPLEFVREWAVNNNRFYVCPIETTIHKIGYAKPMPVLDN